MIAHVVLPYPISRPFSYNVPSKWEPYIFNYQRVVVPFGSKKVKGYVVALEEGENPDFKEIVEPTDIFSLLPKPLLKLIDWMKDHFIVPHGVLMKYALSDVFSVEDFLTIKAKDSSELEGITLKDAYKRYGRESIFSLFFSRKIEFQDVFLRSPFPQKRKKNGYKEVKRTLYISSFERRLEKYIGEIDDVLKKGETCLFFVPPYGLSGKLIYDILKERYAEKVFWYGQESRKKERMQIYFTLGSQSGYIVLSNVIGLFLPVFNLGLIIIERPEDESFTINKRFNLNVADSAIKRSEIEGVPLLVGTIAPPISLVYNSASFMIVKDEKAIKFKVHTLFQEKKRDEISHLSGLSRIISEKVEKKESVAVFIPRKHYSGRLLCLECKKVFSCARCGATLCFSKEKGSVFCPECNQSVGSGDKCGACGSPYISLRAMGAEFLKEILERELSLKVHSVTSDNLEEDLLDDLLKKKRGGVFIIVGTKVLSFLYKVNVENLFVVNWKELKRIWKYRAYEKLHQLFMNLADSLKPKKIFFFGHKEESEIHYIMDSSRVYNEELKKRIELNLPPSKRLVLIELSRKDRKRLEIMKGKVEEYLNNAGLGKHIYGHTLEKYKKGFSVKIVLSGLTRESTSKLFPLFDLYGVTIKVDPEVV